MNIPNREKVHNTSLHALLPVHAHTFMFMDIAQFHSQQLEKGQKAANNAKQMQEYHKSQMVERRARNKAERKEQLDYTKTNMNLLMV